MSEWQELSLNEAATIEIGGTPSRAVQVFWASSGEDGFPWVSIADLKGRVVVNTRERITAKGVTFSNVKYVAAGTLIMSFKLSIGRAAIAGVNLYTNEAIAAIVPKEGQIRSDLLYYVLPPVAKNAITDTAVKGATLNKNSLGKLRLYVPCDERNQHKIVRILQTIDQAIEHTEALIDKYQQIKAGLMHDLFTRGIGANGQLRPTRDQASDLYHQVSIGWIPKGWEENSLESGLSASPKNGFSPKEVDSWEGVYVLGLGCLTKNGFKPKQLKNAPAHARASIAKLEDGDFLISRSNTQELVGLCGIYEDVGSFAIYPDLMIRLVPNKSLDARFLEKYLLSHVVRQRISSIAVGTSGSMVKINATTLKAFKIAFPPVPEQQLIVEKLVPIERQVDSLKIQMDKLQKQRAGLMHDLLTGKVPVTVVDDAAEVADV
jgi:type I restriction enzyme S subunit